MDKKSILVFGASGFIATYLIDALLAEGHEVTASDISDEGRVFYAGKDVAYVNVDITRREDFERLELKSYDAVVHLAACQPANVAEKTYDPRDYINVNVIGTLNILDFCRECGAGKIIYATFCHNLARDLPIQIHNPAASLSLVYVDDVITAMIAALDEPVEGTSQGTVSPQYTTTLGELADQIKAFGNCRTTLLTDRVGTGLVRALYATYVSYLPNEHFAYDVPAYADPRGVFVEMLKTPDSGQFSYFTAHPGVTRGGHYHHTKTEKFLVIKGRALFRFRHLLTEEVVELTTTGEKPQVVDTIPGWAHDITNVGDDDMVVMLWANEIFDRANPDTYACPL